MSIARPRKKLVAIALAACFLLAAIGVGCADRFLLFPSRHPVDAGRAVPLTIEVEGRTVEVYVARSPKTLDGREPEAFVLEFCGNATRAEHIAQFVADRWKDYPVEVWVMNYPGFGKSEGRAKLALIPGAALATYDALEQRAGDRPIFLAGNSMGATPALYVASERPCAGLILQNVPPLRRVILRRNGWWNLWMAAVPVAMQVPSALNAPDTAPRVMAPAVFLVAERDTLVPPDDQRVVVRAFAGPKRVITLDEAGHNSSLTQAQEHELAAGIDWLWKNSQTARAASDGRAATTPTTSAPARD